MNAEDLKKWIGKKVCLVLRNGFRYTTVIPEFSGNLLEIVDKFGRNISLNCDSISVIYSVRENAK